MDDLNANIATGLVGWVALLVSGWIMLGIRSTQGEPILRFEFRREPPWGMWDIFLVVFLVMGPQLGVAVYFQPLDPGSTPDHQDLKELLRWNAIVSVISIVGMLAYFQFRPGARLVDVGVNLRQVGKQVGIGIACFLLVAPLVFAIQAAFVVLLKFESKHPLIELIQEDTTAFQLCAFLAVVVAPISEELLFRGLLQGWLQRIPLFHADFDAFLLGIRRTDEDDDRLHYVSKKGNHPVAWLPIVIASAVFALMHWSHGPDPIPLFFLSVALGYVYQRTHRLLPCMIVHACLNGTTMLMLWLNLDQLPS